MEVWDRFVWNELVIIGISVCIVCFSVVVLLFGGGKRVYLCFYIRMRVLDWVLYDSLFCDFN